MIVTLRRTLLALALCALVAPFAAFGGESDPVITVPADMTVEAQSFSGATVTYTASAVDYRHGRKVLSGWPSRPRFRLRARWTFNHRSFRLRPGSYTWLVWPAYGPTSRPRFGRLLGMSSFVVVKKATAR